MPGALEGLKVIDLSRVLGGPYCAQMLADHGADVIKVEPPQGDETRLWGPPFDAEGISAYYAGINRNKRTIALDLAKPDGRTVLLKLLEDADVLIENFKTGTMEKWGLGYGELAKKLPRLIHARVSGFGADGPLGGFPGYDAMVQASAGLVSVNGSAESGPVRIGVPVVDLSTGMNATIGIMMALYERDRTGLGRWVHTSLLEAQVHMLDFQAARWLMDGEVAGQAGNDHPTGIPMGTFPTSDGHINLAASAGRLWKQMCEAMGHSEWTDVEKWKTGGGRSEDRATLNATISQVTRTQPSSYWMDTLEAAGIPCGPIYTVDQVFADPQVKHLNIAAPTTHPQRGATALINSPLNLSDVPKGIRHVAPPAGEQTDEVLRSVGYTDAELASMRAKGII